jgi:oligoribonuclease (3'-5' exoribonuclease)
MYKEIMQSNSSFFIKVEKLAEYIKEYVDNNPSPFCNKEIHKKVLFQFAINELNTIYNSAMNFEEKNQLYILVKDFLNNN